MTYKIIRKCLHIKRANSNSKVSQEIRNLTVSQNSLVFREGQEVILNPKSSLDDHNFNLNFSYKSHK